MVVATKSKVPEGGVGNGFRERFWLVSIKSSRIGGPHPPRFCGFFFLSSAGRVRPAAACSLPRLFHTVLASAEYHGSLVPVSSVEGFANDLQTSSPALRDGRARGHDRRHVHRSAFRPTK